jgi:ElaB/YqjD/DUF883 family membrane-anchored ribosome-binding protein
MMRLPSLTSLDEDNVKMDQPTSRVVDLLTGDVDALRAEVARLSEQLDLYIKEEKSVMARILARQATGAKRVLADELAKASATAGEYTDAAKGHIGDMRDATLSYVSKKPLQSLAVVAGIGLVLGLLSKGRS